jgi:4-hydroxy-tetrahydrodipicolinate reductase
MSKPSTATANVVLLGLGAVGSFVMDVLKEGYPKIRVLGAADKSPRKTGRKLSDLYPDVPGIDGIVVSPSIEQCFAGINEKVDVVYHMTESVPHDIEPQLAAAINAGANVISAGEAMFHPALRHGEFTARIDALARSRGVSVVGVGINPGFSFDALPLLLARLSSGVRKVDIDRVIDVTGTGPGDIAHVGYLLRPHEFEAKIKTGEIVGHMGAPESIALLAERLGIDIDTIEERWETEVADFEVESGVVEIGMIEPGRVIGITQFGEGKSNGETVISLRLVMYYSPEKFGLELRDRVEIMGSHHITATLTPAAISIFGAANAIVNATHDVMAAPPGVVNVLDFSMGGPNRGGFAYAIDAARPHRPGSIPLVKRPL